jgi:hypothetical protein
MPDFKDSFFKVLINYDKYKLTNNITNNIKWGYGLQRLKQPVYPDGYSFVAL